MNRIALTEDNRIALNEDMLLHLSRHYLSERDRLALALSGTSERFILLYASNRKQLVTRECYFITTHSWELFIHQQKINPSLITTFDASSCYWLPASVLCHSIKQMSNLEELSIHDTKISLSNLPELFEACQKIVKFSLTLSEKSLDPYEEGVMAKESLDWLKQGFAGITHLKITSTSISTVALNDYEYYYLQPWIVTIGVLKWCRDCVDLVIQVTTTEKNCSSNFFIDKQKIDMALKKLKPQFGWMKTLKSLAILRSDSHDSYHYYIIKQLLFFLKEIQNESRSLERLIIIKKDYIPINYCLFLEWFMTGPSVKSFALFKSYFWVSNPLTFNHERFRELEQLAQITFSHRLEHLTKLKFVHGHCGNDIQGLNDFLESHPNLVELRFKDPIKDERNQFFGAGDWKLLSLKDLVYHCVKVDQRIMDHFMKACPNLQQLEIEISPSQDKISSTRFFSSLQFKHLTRLCLREYELFDGSYLPSIFQKCPKLERLHLESFEWDYSNIFLVNLAKCLPNAANLRDLRMSWKYTTVSPTDLLSVLNALKCCPKFERFGFLADHEWNSHVDEIIVLSSDYYAPLENSLVKFVKDMPHLVALCLAGLGIDSNGVVKRQLIDEVLPERPAFWFYLSSGLPHLNDPSIPKIHYEEIVNPVHAWDSPPRF